MIYAWPATHQRTGSVQTSAVHPATKQRRQPQSGRTPATEQGDKRQNTQLHRIQATRHDTGWRTAGTHLHVNTDVLVRTPQKLAAVQMIPVLANVENT